MASLAHVTGHGAGGSGPLVTRHGGCGGRGPQVTRCGVGLDDVRRGEPQVTGADRNPPPRPRAPGGPVVGVLFPSCRSEGPLALTLASPFLLFCCCLNFQFFETHPITCVVTQVVTCVTFHSYQGKWKPGVLLEVTARPLRGWSMEELIFSPRILTQLPAGPHCPRRSWPRLAVNRGTDNGAATHGCAQYPG